MSKSLDVLSSVIYWRSTALPLPVTDRTGGSVEKCPNKLHVVALVTAAALFFGSGSAHSDE